MRRERSGAGAHQKKKGHKKKASSERIEQKKRQSSPAARAALLLSQLTFFSDTPNAQLARAHELPDPNLSPAGRG